MQATSINYFLQGKFVCRKKDEMRLEKRDFAYLTVCFMRYGVCLGEEVLEIGVDVSFSSCLGLLPKMTRKREKNLTSISLSLSLSLSLCVYYDISSNFNKILRKGVSKSSF